MSEKNKLTILPLTFLFCVQLAIPSSAGNFFEDLGDGAGRLFRGAAGNLQNNIENIPNDIRDPRRIPKNIGREARTLFRNIDRERRRLQAIAGAPALAAWIRGSRRDAINAEVRSIPLGVRRFLTKYFKSELLDRVRYRIGRGGFFALQNSSFYVGDAIAITLDDVIVFRSQADARNPVLWAHELEHVKQYSRLGIRRFAKNYIDDWGKIEREAEQTARDFFRAVPPPQPLQRTRCRAIRGFCRWKLAPIGSPCYCFNRVTQRNDPGRVN